MAVARPAPEDIVCEMASVVGGVPGGSFWWNVRDRVWDIEVWVPNRVPSRSKIMSLVGEDILFP